MNKADKQRDAQRARNLERIAQSSNLRADWQAAANAWKSLGNTDRYEECKLAAEMCKR